MLLDHARTEASRNSLLLNELERFLRRQSAEVQASLLAFVHLTEPNGNVGVRLDVTEAGELSLVLSGRQGPLCLDG